MYRQENEINGEDSSLLESDAMYVDDELPLSRRSYTVLYSSKRPN